MTNSDRYEDENADLNRGGGSLEYLARTLARFKRRLSKEGFAALVDTLASAEAFPEETASDGPRPGGAMDSALLDRPSPAAVRSFARRFPGAMNIRTN